MPDTATTTQPQAPENKLAYNAVENKGRRQAPKTRVTAEHVQLKRSKRTKLIATTQDQMRNIAFMAWATNRHLDYVSRFKLNFRTGNEALDKTVKNLFDWHARPINFDVSRRFGREEHFRMFEREKVVSGDAGFNKIDSMLAIQSIESDLVAYPKDAKSLSKRNQALLEKTNKDTGLVFSKKYPGRIEKLCLCNRGKDGKGVVFDHFEAIENVFFDGYFTRFGSQSRGVSPLSTAINSVQDLCENFEWALLKQKVHSLFGVAIMRDYTAAGSTVGEENQTFGGAANITEDDSESETSPTAGIETSLQQIAPDQMLMLDMDTKGKVDTIESKTPSGEFREFSQLMLRIVFLALDIPYTAFDSAKASFSGLIADNNLYEVSCKWKREKNKWARKSYSDWLLYMAWNGKIDGFDLKASANAAGINRLREVQDTLEWIPCGSPWLQKLNEVTGDIKACGSALDNLEDCNKRKGLDVYENIDKNARVLDYAKDKGVPIFLGDSGQRATEEVETDTENEKSEVENDE